MKSLQELRQRRNGISNEAELPQLDEAETGEKKRPESEEAALERHYTVKEVAEIWHLDEKMIRRIFGAEPGVVSIGSDESRFRRAYRTLWIPESVLLRVHWRLRRTG
ncbi:MAG TPA: hypothetical protein VFP59_16300 [Candidatus Angelobacter sp.]|nr:hypothetical protein [Candidatus Angelobacter sp.]